MTGTGTRRGWRVRRCPSCGVARYASEFETLTYGSNWNKEGAAERACPECGHHGETWEFAVVREYHPSQGDPRNLPRTTERPPRLRPTTDRPSRIPRERTQTVGDRMAEIFSKDD